MYAHDFVKVAVASPKIKVGDADSNIKEIVKLLKEAEANQAAITVFPELTICGYSVGDLVFQKYLYRDNRDALKYLLQNNPYSGVAIIGTYFIIQDKIFNCSAVIQKDEILAIVPKSYLPHTYEFYESRYFVSGYDETCDSIDLFGKKIPFGRFVFTNEDKMVSFGVEICEDFWAPFAPHEVLYANGAMIVFNPSASPEVIGKREVRTHIAQTITYKSKGAYVYTSTNASESTSEVVFSNHKMIYQNGEKILDDNLITLESNITDRKSTRLNSSHVRISYAVFCLKKKIHTPPERTQPLAAGGGFRKLTHSHHRIVSPRIARTSPVPSGERSRTARICPASRVTAGH